MSKSKSRSLFSSMSVNELVEYFEKHDMGEYWEQMPEANFYIDIKRRTHLVAIEEEIISKLTEIANSQNVSTEALINSWLKEKITETTYHY